MIEEIKKALASFLRARPTWQECVGQRPHMIEDSAATAGYTARDSYEVVDRIAVIDVSGILVNEAWDGWRTSGYGRIAGEVEGAANDPNVDGIMLRVNSPGGECTNAFETADAIIAAGNKKPVWSVADSSAYSAGYLLASAADRIYVSPKTGGVGSIGVYAVHLDFSKMLEDAGIKATFVEQPKGKSDGHPYKPLSDSARKGMTEMVDGLATMFFEHVSARRDMTVATVKQMNAGLFMGSDAIASGLADKAGSLSTALTEFRAHLDARKQAQLYPMAAASATTSEGGPTMENEQPTADANAAPPAAPPAAPVAEETPTPPVAYNDAEEVTALCAIAGLPATDAHAFIQQKKPAADVRAELLSRKAAASGEEIISHGAPASGTSAGNTNTEDSAIVKACAKLAQAGKENK